MEPIASSWWRWIQENSSGLQAIFTAGAVLVAALYAWLTRQLASQARRQADVTREVFESSHRPWLNIFLKGDAHYTSANHFSATCSVKNYGNVPAVAVTWALRIEGGDGTSVERQSPEQWRRPIFPGDEVEIELREGAELIVAQPQTRIAFSVTYRGIHCQTYVTRAVFHNPQRPEWWEFFEKEIT